jgi:hypothetical protein
MAWNSEFNFGVEYLGFHIFFQTYMVHKRDVLIGCLSCVSRLDWLNAIEVVKQHSAIIVGLIQKLARRFLVQDIINAIGVISPQFWLQPETKHKFKAQLSILKVHNYFGKHVGPKKLFIPPLFDEHCWCSRHFFSSSLCLPIAMLP